MYSSLASDLKKLKKLALLRIFDNENVLIILGKKIYTDS